MVTTWAAAAERLTGYAAADVIGGPLPHLTPAQRDELVRMLPDFDDWAGEVPIVYPRRHADGRTIQVCVTRYVRLHDADGRPAGYGSFFRAVRSTDTRTHLRNSYSQQLAASVDTEDALDALGLVVTELLGASAAHLLHRDDDGAWRGWLGVGVHREVTERLRAPHPQQLDRAMAERRCLAATLDAGEPVDVLLVPAGPSREGALLALVDVAPEEGPDEELAIALASEAWATLQRVDAVRELQGKVEILEAIAGVASAAGLETATVARHVARTAAAALSCERAALYLWDDAGRRLRLTAFHADDRDWDEHDEVQVPGLTAVEELAARAWSGRQRVEDGPFVAQDAASCPWLDGPWAPEHGTVSLYAAPLAVRDQAVGVLVVAHTDANPRGFTSLCTQVGEALAEQAALALLNARLFDAQRAAAAASRDADQQRADWVASITHDLRSPVTAIIGFVRTLQRSGERMSPEDQDDALAVIERQSMRVSRMLENMMDAARAQADRLEPEVQPVDLATCVADAVAVTAPEDRARVTVDAPHPVVACGDPGQLTRVVQNLVVNALVHTPAPLPVEVHVGAADDLGVVQVVDHGPGLPTDVDLFSAYARGPQGGTGLGLYTVRHIVELHGGRIETAETPGGGATLTIRVPLTAPDGC